MAVAEAIDCECFESVFTSEQHHTSTTASELKAIHEHVSAAESLDAIVVGGFPRTISADFLREIRGRNPRLPVVVIFDSATPREIANTIQFGATGVLVHPAFHETIVGRIGDVKAARIVQTEDPSSSAVIAASSAMQRLVSVVRRAGPSDVPVLIQGETGVGKEVFARQLHRLSPRAAKPFLKVNCAALPAELIESELFGYHRGAFTGADHDKPGLFELADAGVLMLDEIGDMDLKLQAKLLQVLQDQQFYRLGGKKPVRVNVRVIAATHADLESAVANRAFRADLYYRLNVINLYVPPLRERREDILLLAGALIQRYLGVGEPPPSLPLELQHALLMYDWPGNVRELENVIRKLLILRNPESLAAELNFRRNRKVAPSAGYRHRMPSSGPVVLEKISKSGGDAEAAAIRAALDAARWNRKVAAYLLGIGYKALLYKMKKLAIADLEIPVIPKHRATAENG